MSNKAIVITTIILLVLAWIIWDDSNWHVISTIFIIGGAFIYWLFCEMGEQYGNELQREVDQLDFVMRFGTEEEKQTAIQYQILREQQRTRQQIVGLGLMHIFDKWFK
jgi:meiotically up-regulated gene 157 (Mug157) protein